MNRRWSLLLVVVLTCVLIALRCAPLLLGNVAALAMQKTWQNVFSDLRIPVCQPHARFPFLIDLVGKVNQVASPPAMLSVIQARLLYLQGDCAGASTELQAGLVRQGSVASPAGALVYVGSPVAAPDTLRANLSLYAEAHGLRAELAHDHAAAEAWYRWSVQLSAHLSAVNHLTTIYVNANRTIDAQSAWQALIDVSPQGSVGFWGATARLAELRKDYAQAVLAYQELLKLSPDDYSVWMQMGSDYQNLNERSAAQGAFLRAIHLRPDKVQPYLVLGTMALDAHDWRTASDWFNRADQAAPAYAEPRVYLGWIHCLNGDYTSARADFDIAQRRKAGSAILYYYTARCLYLQNDIDQAVSAMQHAIQLDRADGILPWYWIMQQGDWLAEQSKWSQARDAYQQALNWHPGDATIEQRLSHIQGQNGN